MSNVMQGPATVTELKPKPYDFTRFDHLIDALQMWRDADHEDWHSLHRNQVIEIIEGARALRRSGSE